MKIFRYDLFNSFLYRYSWVMLPAIAFNSDVDLFRLNLEAFEDLSISAGDTGTTIGSADTTFATLTGISPEQITADDLVSPNFLAATFIADDTAAIEAKAV